MAHQHTLAATVRCSGKGLHSGAEATLALHAAAPDTGIVFVRTDLSGTEIPALPSSVTSLYRATTLGVGSASVATVEHLLAALFALGIDNARIEVDGPEVPVLDGSAAPFVEWIRDVGSVVQPQVRPILRVLRRVEVRDRERSICALPCDVFRIRYAIDFPHPLIRQQVISIEELTGTSFERELASARTFGFLEEVDALRAAGLGLGGDLGNTVVLDAETVLNPDGLRYPDEFVRHKALDLVGDLSLLGASLEAEVSVDRGGHALHQRLVTALLTEPGASEWVGVPSRAGQNLDCACGRPT